MSVKVQIVFYSTYGHVYHMAEAAATGVRDVAGAEVEIYRVPEVLSDEVLEAIGAKEAQKAFAHVPVMDPDQLAEADAIIVGVPTRFGNMAGQMRNFWDRTGNLWMSGALIGKVGSVFTSTGSQHGGQETTIITTQLTLMHHGMIIVGVPYSNPQLTDISEMIGGSPYGASTITGTDGSRLPHEKELALVREQGRRVADIASALKRGQA